MRARSSGLDTRQAMRILRDAAEGTILPRIREGLTGVGRRLVGAAVSRLARTDDRLQGARRLLGPAVVPESSGAVVPYDAPGALVVAPLGPVAVPPIQQQPVPIPSFTTHVTSVRGLGGGSDGAAVSTSAQPVPVAAGRVRHRITQGTVDRLKRTRHSLVVPRGLGPPSGRLGPAIDEKYFDGTSAFWPGVLAFDPTTINAFHLDIIERGDSVTQRDGKSWMETSIQFNLTCTLSAAATYPQVAEGLFMLVWDRTPMKAAVDPSHILTPVGGFLTQSMRNRDYQSRFVFLYAKRFTAVGGSTAASAFNDSSVIFSLSENVRFPYGLVTECESSDTTGIIGNRIFGALYVVATGYTYTNTGSTSYLQGLFNYRINFRDC